MNRSEAGDPRELRADSELTGGEAKPASRRSARIAIPGRGVLTPPPLGYGRNDFVCQARATTKRAPFQWKREWSKPPVGQQFGSRLR